MAEENTSAKPEPRNRRTGLDTSATVQLFSKTSRDSKDWAAILDEYLQLELFDAAPEDSHAQVSTTLLDVDRAEQTKDDANPPGRVFAFDVPIKVEDGQQITLARCHMLRVSPAIRKLETKQNVETIIYPSDLFTDRVTPGLAVFDMDSTLIQQEVIDELARSVGRYDEVAAVTEAAMRGELDFEASLRARVGKLEGVSTGIWEKLKAEVITFTPGARELAQFFKNNGWKTAVLSGGFTPLAYWVKETLGLDYAYANELAIDESTATLTGKLKPGALIVGAATKRELLLSLAASNHIPVERTIAVGDGSNDLLMMGAAGLGIAFNAKRKVQEAAPARLNSDTLMDVAYILGYTKDQITRGESATGR